jgi:hypothetical protein
MWTDLLKEILEEMEEDELTPQPPASDADIQFLLADLANLGNVKTLPDSYIQLLKMMNGLEWNGLSIYSTKTMPLEDTDDKLLGLIEANQIWRDLEDHKRYLFFGEAEISLYCQDLTTSAFLELDRSSDTVIETYHIFENILSKALKDSLE